MIINIGKFKLKVKEAKTKEEISQGMKGLTFDRTFSGMLFFMNSGDHAFWMKDCIISLDIIFIKNGVVNKIHHKCSPCFQEPCPNYIGNGDLVLELRGGSCKKMGIKEGDKVLIN